MAFHWFVHFASGAARKTNSPNKYTYNTLPLKAVPFLGTPGHCDTTACSGSTSIDTTSIQVGNAGTASYCFSKSIFRCSNFSIWGFPKMVVPNNHGVFLLKMTILGCFGGTTIYLLGHLFLRFHSAPVSNSKVHLNIFTSARIAVSLYLEIDPTRSIWFARFSDKAPI